MSIKTRPGFHGQLKIVAALFALVAIIECINLLTGRALNQFGIIPRELPSIGGVLASPLLHGSFWHLSANLVPLCLFSFLMLQYGVRRWLLVTLWLIISTGLLVWLFGRYAVHIGSSGLIYGYLGYLLLAGFLAGRVKLILISLLVAAFYGGLIFGILPTRGFISWESHLFGFVSGLVAARFWSRPSHG